jgi:hypothetical protein
MIDSFQNNSKKIIICTIAAGGVGISLHDIHGGHPRMSIISPPWSGILLTQALGRIHRAGSKSPALQRIVYCSCTYEEKVAALIEEKVANISGINDDDVSGMQYDKEVIEVVENMIEDSDGKKTFSNTYKVLEGNAITQMRNKIEMEQAKRGENIIKIEKPKKKEKEEVIIEIPKKIKRLEI